MAIPQETAGTSRTKRRHRRRRRFWNDRHFRWVPDGNGDWRVQAYVFHHQPQTAPSPLPRARAANRRRRRWRRPSPSTRGRQAPTRAPFGLAQAVRLLNRAGFGPVPGQADALASMGLIAAVQSLTRPSGAARLNGPAPVDDEGAPIAPADAWGHDHLWWLDRMVRSDQPLVERMALVFHDWFATSEGRRLQAAADDRPVEPLPGRLLRLLPRPLQGGDGRPGDAAVAERRRKRQGGAERELRAAR